LLQVVAPKLSLVLPVTLAGHFVLDAGTQYSYDSYPD